MPSPYFLLGFFAVAAVTAAAAAVVVWETILFFFLVAFPAERSRTSLSQTSSGPDDPTSHSSGVTQVGRRTMVTWAETDHRWRSQFETHGHFAFTVHGAPRRCHELFGGWITHRITPLGLFKSFVCDSIKQPPPLKRSSLLSCGEYNLPQQSVFYALDFTAHHTLPFR